MDRRALPEASPRAQYLLAAVFWTVPGVLLPVRGLVWANDGFATPALAVALPIVVALGLAKTLLLDRAVARIADRIARRGPGFILGCFSGRTWLLVAAMPVIGMALRFSGIPLHFVGLFYVAIGVALVVSGRGLWRVGLAPDAVPEPADAS